MDSVRPEETVRLPGFASVWRRASGAGARNVSFTPLAVTFVPPFGGERGGGAPFFPALLVFVAVVFTVLLAASFSGGFFVAFFAPGVVFEVVFCVVVFVAPPFFEAAVFEGAVLEAALSRGGVF